MKRSAFCVNCNYHFKSVQPSNLRPKCSKCGHRAKWCRVCPICGYEINEDKLNSY